MNVLKYNPNHHHEIPIYQRHVEPRTLSSYAFNVRLVATKLEPSVYDDNH